MILKHSEKTESIKEITRAGAVKEILGSRKRQPSFKKKDVQQTEDWEPWSTCVDRVGAEPHLIGNITEIVSRHWSEVTHGKLLHGVSGQDLGDIHVSTTHVAGNPALTCKIPICPRNPHLVTDTPIPFWEQHFSFGGQCYCGLWHEEAATSFLKDPRGHKGGKFQGRSDNQADHEATHMKDNPILSAEWGK